MISELLFKNGYNQERYDISENGTETRFSNSKFKITRLFLNPFTSIVKLLFFFISLSFGIILDFIVNRKLNQTN